MLGIYSGLAKRNANITGIPGPIGHVLGYMCRLQQISSRGESQVRGQFYLSHFVSILRFILFFGGVGG